MTSQVSPYIIDGTYPIAGQDNDSQGFRDNFTNIRNNFAFIKTELEDLQTNSVLKAALANTTLNNDMLNALLTKPQLAAYSETYYDGGAAGGAQVINYSAGNFQRISTSSSVSLTFSNWPSASPAKRGVIRLWISVSNIAHTVTFPAAVATGFPSEMAGISSLVVTFPQTGDYFYELSSADAGISIFAREIGRAPNKVQGNLTVTSGLTVGGPTVNSNYVYLTTTTGSTITANTSYSQVFLDSTSSATLASQTLSIPATATNGFRLCFRAVCPITTVTYTTGNVQFSAAATMTGALSSGNVSLNLMYNSTRAQWLRVS